MRFSSSRQSVVFLAAACCVVSLIVPSVARPPLSSEVVRISDAGR
jgi:hypothetical protein